MHCELLRLKAYVQEVADQSASYAEALIEIAAMSVKKSSIRQRVPFKVVDGPVSGSVRLMVKSAGDRAAGTADATMGDDATTGSDATAGLDATTGSDASGGSDAAGQDAIALGSDSSVAGEAGARSSDSGQNQPAGSSDGGSNDANDVGNQLTLPRPRQSRNRAGARALTTPWRYFDVGFSRLPPLS